MVEILYQPVLSPAAPCRLYEGHSMSAGHVHEPFEILGGSQNVALCRAPLSALLRLLAALQGLHARGPAPANNSKFH
ncbi:MAG: hypothetical protein V8Q84_03295 [Bilophila sp.]